MNVQVAREFARLLLEAADKAEHAGRNELNKADMAIFEIADDAARTELQAEIDKHILG